jgi:membrane protein
VVLEVAVLAAFATLYGFGPSRRPGHRPPVLPGVLAGAALWSLVSWLFSDYAADLARFDATYGPLGAAAGVMLWFWVSAYILLAGAELNAALDPHRDGISESAR